MLDELRSDFRRHGSSFGEGGFWALAVYRFGRWSLERRSRLGRYVTSKLYGALKLVVRFATGVELERETRIGADLHLIHGRMIAIHPTAVIGDRVGLMHGVTIGTNMGDDAPILGNDVFVGCHASVLGGVRIGDGARIAANTLVISDVPAGAVAIGVPARIARDIARPSESLERGATPTSPRESR
jgi:serine O-acetyltransferase